MARLIDPGTLGALAVGIAMVAGASGSKAQEHWPPAPGSRTMRRSAARRRVTGISNSSRGITSMRRWDAGSGFDFAVFGMPA